METNIIDNACRVCLKDSEPLKSVFDEAEDFNNRRLCDLLESIEDIKIDSKDIYPKFICCQCTEELLITVKFYEKCRKAKEIFSHFITDEICIDFDNGNHDNTATALQENKNYDEDDIDDFIPINCGISNIIEYDGSIKSGKLLELKKESDEVVNIHPINDECIPQKQEEDDFIEQIIETDYEKVENEVKNKEEIDDIREESDDNILNYIIIEGFDGNIIAPIHRLDNAQKRNGNKNSNKSLLKNNKSKTTSSKQFNCNCDVCGACFTNVNNLRRHLESHGFQETYECSKCLWSFSDSEKLKTHFVNVHLKVLNDDNSDKVDSDEENKNKLLPSMLDVEKKNNFEKHSHSKKKVKIRPKCEYCAKVFVSNSALIAHRRLHTGDRPFKCSRCDKAFATQGAVVLHERRHTGFKPFICEFCNKRFVESSNLKVHMRSHTGEKPHKCTVCGRGFTRVYLLQLHQRTHTGEKPYKCTWCEKAFAQQSDMVTHRRIHTGEKPYECSLCEKCFSKSSALTIHMRKHLKSDRNKRKEKKSKSKQKLEQIEENKEIEDRKCIEGIEVNGNNNQENFPLEIFSVEDKSIDEIIISYSNSEIPEPMIQATENSAGEINDSETCVAEDLSCIMEE